MPEPLPYDFNDVQRYLRREMSVQEMHAFEKAMMDDPFLADALEGAMKMDTTQVNLHLSGIREKIQVKANARVVPFRQSAWLKMVAVFALLIGGSFVMYLLFESDVTQNNRETTVAAVEQQDSLGPSGEVKNEISEQSSAATDTRQQAPPFVGNRPATATTETRPIPEPPNNNADRNVERKDNAMAAADEADATTPVTNNTSAGSAVAMTSKNSVQDSSYMATDAATAKSLASATPMAETMTAKRSTYKPLIPTDKINVPIVGWPSYQAYINRVIDSAAGTQKVEAGTVTISFALDAAGKPSQVKVISPYGSEFNRIVAEAVGRGSSWKSSSPKDTITLKAPF